MKQKPTSYNFKVLLVILALATMLSFIAVSPSLSKYTDTQQEEYFITSHDFYFTSNLLTSTGLPEHEFLTEFNIELYNFVGDDIATYEINYTISIDITQSTGSNPTVNIEDDKKGKLTANNKTIATITVTPDAEVTKFTITATTTNGYGATLYIMCSRQ